MMDVPAHIEQMLVDVPIFFSYMRNITRVIVNVFPFHVVFPGVRSLPEDVVPFAYEIAAVSQRP